MCNEDREAQVLARKIKHAKKDSTQIRKKPFNTTP